ncbi:MAG: hypothetical protein QNJ54_05990 [Prochloraceae cyanobacterium]|nr:hypothetical protein [Prochloraceae cyanobacterium]
MTGIIDYNSLTTILSGRYINSSNVPSGRLTIQVGSEVYGKNNS